MKITYRQRILFYFLVIFGLFTLSVIILEQKHERQSKTEMLEAKLDDYVAIINSYIVQNKLNDSTITNISTLATTMPNNIRVSIINNDGLVLYDKDITNVNTLQNHLDRPEIRSALFQNYGVNIRMSASTKHEYIYYAKHYAHYYIRVALPYDIKTKSLLTADSYFVYIISILFILVLVLLYFVTNRFGRSISQLKELTSNIKNDRALESKIDFTDDELGEIGRELDTILKQKQKSKRDLEAEREKLIQHLQFSEEGLGIFDSSLNKIYINTHFIQYINLIVDKPTLKASTIFKEDTFKPILDFVLDKDKTQQIQTLKLSKNGKTFLVKTIIFEDNSFELSIIDITKTEKNRILKQEMTSNIAHELRTPVTSLRGYLETLDTQNIDEPKSKQFIHKAYLQSIRLSELIEDISLLSKIEESSTSFMFEKIDVAELINTIRIDVSDKLAANAIQFYSAIKPSTCVRGNPVLLYSIISNLVNNSINYGGQNIEIHIDNYMDENGILYFSYYDTGKGVEEQYLNRLFERFYRVNEGRTRSTGGSGLGLSIVRNAILLHKGEVQAKIHTSGGLEILFSLPQA